MYGPGGGGPGGPRGGRPPRGFGFGGGMFGPGGRAWGPDFKFPGPIPRAPGGSVASTGDYYSGKKAKIQTEFYCNSRMATQITGSKVKGYITACRLYAMGPLHYNVFLSRVDAATQDLAEHRITDEQCKYRKLKAADKYYTYLYKVGLYSKEVFEFELKNYAKGIGVIGDETYIIDQVIDESSVGRSR